MGEAVTFGGQKRQGEGVLGDLARLLGGGEPDTPRQAAQHPLRVGFVKVDGKGLSDHDVYVAADQISAVADGTVQSAVHRDDLAAER